MHTSFRLFAAGIVSAIACSCVRAEKSSLAAGLALTSTVVLTALGIELFRPVIDYLQTLRTGAGLESAVFAPLLRIGCIGVLTELSCAFCAEAGERSICRVLELGGCAASLCALLPLLESVMGFIRPYLGG